MAYVNPEDLKPAVNIKRVDEGKMEINWFDLHEDYGYVMEFYSPVRVASYNFYRF